MGEQTSFFAAAAKPSELMRATPGSAGFPGTESDLENYYRWEEPGTEITVLLKLEAIERLQLAALHARETLPMPGVEIGGILIGRTELSPGRTVIVVEDFEPVIAGSESFYRLSEEGTVNLEATLLRVRSDADRTLSVVGFYRSHNRKGLFLSSTDLKLIQTYFERPENVFLIIKTLPGRACTAGFFFWKNGRIQTEFTDSEAPLMPVRSQYPALVRPSRIEGTPATLTEGSVNRVHKIQQTATDFAEPWPEQGTTEILRTNHPRRMLLPIATALGVTALAILAYVKTGNYRPWGTPSNTKLTLGLNLERTGDGFTITWDRDSPKITAAERAILSIRDGGRQKTYTFDSAQLRFGSVFYRPATDTCQIRLEAYQAGKLTAVESIISLEAGNSSRRAPESPGVDMPSQKTRHLSTHGGAARRGTARPALGAEDGGSRGTKNVADRSSLPPSASKSPVSSRATQTSLVDQPARPLVIETPSFPDPALTSGIRPLTAQIVNRLKSTPDLVSPPPISRGESDSKSGPLQVNLEGAQAPAPPEAVVTYVGPQALHTAPPVVPSAVRQMLTTEVEVDVTVTIDVNGAVTDARVSRTKGRIAGLLVRSALQAARQYRFRPARKNDQSVQSTIILPFRFTRTGL